MAGQGQASVQTGRQDFLKESHCTSSSRDGASSTIEGGNFNAPSAIKNANLIAQVRCVLDMFGQASVQQIVAQFVLIKTRNAEELDLVIRVVVCTALVDAYTLDSFALYAEVLAVWKAYYLDLPDQEGDARTFQRTLRKIIQKDYEDFRRDMGCDFVVTLQSTMLELGNWALTCTTVGGAIVLDGLVMPSDFRYEDVQEILAKDKGIAPFRVQLVSCDGEQLTENNSDDKTDDRLLAQMMLIGSLFQRGLVSIKVIACVMYDLIGIREILPSEEEFACAFTLCAMIGPCLDATVNGKSLMTEFARRLHELQQFQCIKGEMYFPRSHRMKVQELLDLRERNWQLQ